MYQFGPKVSIGLAMLGATASIANFAFDASMINSLSIIPGYLEYFNLDTNMMGLLVAIINIGCIVGLPFAEPILDRLGRKWGIFTGSAISLVGSAISVAAPNVAALLCGRFIIGVSFIINGAGAASWIMEIAPPKHQALLANVMLSSLPLAGTIASIILLGIYDKEGEWAWRGGLVGELVGPMISMMTVPFAPESFRWLVANGRSDEAFDSMVRLHANGDRNDPQVLMQFKEITETIAYEKENAGSWKSLVSPAPQLRRFTISVLINIFFQISGSSFMPYFFTLILVRAGIEDLWTLLVVSTALCVWAFVSNISGIYLIEKLGKKTMLLISTPILSICFAILAILTARNDATEDPAYGKAACFIVFVFQWAAFSCWMILTYSYPSQILKYSQRSRGVSVSQAVGYAFATLMAYILPLAVEKISWLYYAMNAGWNVGIVLVIWWLFVETKGKTLEEIDLIFEGVVHFNAGVNDKGEIVPVLDALDVTQTREGGPASITPSKDDQKTLPVTSRSVV